MANRHRGELRITLCGQDITLFPNFDSLTAFEEASGMTMYEALDAVREKKLSLKAVVAALWSGWRGACKGDQAALRQVPSLAAVGDMVVQHGWPSCLAMATEYIVGTVTDPKDPDAGKGEPASK